MLLAILMSATTVSAQRIGVGTNGLYWLTATPNADVHVRMSRRTSLDVGFAARPRCVVKDFGMKFVDFSPELRVWLSRNGMQHHFVGVAAQAAMYTAQWRGSGYVQGHRGDVVGLGATYGYAWMLNGRLNLEVEAGLGCFYARDTKNGQFEDGEHVFPRERILFPAPIKLGVNLVYFFKPISSRKRGASMDK